MKILIILCLILCIAYPAYAQERKVVCYWNSNSHIHVGLPGYFNVSNIDPNICTHIIYAHIYFTTQMNIRWTSDDSSAEFVKLKDINPDVKLLIGVGGPYWGTIYPSQIMSGATTRLQLAQAIKSFLTDHLGFDGCDFDWQYPSNDNEKSYLVLFLNTLRQELSTQKILSISVATRNEDIARSYDIPQIANNVDFINLNSYDLRGVISDSATAFHSPFSKDPTDVSPEAEWNAVSIVNSWTTRGVASNKLTLGIATYGRSFLLSDVNNYNVDAPIISIGSSSKFLAITREPKFNVIPYAEICWNLKQNDTNWNSFWSEKHIAPYAVFNNDQWVGYDNVDSVGAKLHLVIDNDLAGVNYASIDYDDFAGECGVTFPLIRLGYDGLVIGDIAPNPISTTTTLVPGLTTPETTITTEEITEETTTEETTEDVTSPTPEITTEESTESTTESPEPTTTVKTTTTSTKSTGTTEFKTPPITPSTTEIIGSSAVTEDTTKQTDGSDDSTNDASVEVTTQSEIIPITSTTNDFKAPPVTPTSTLEPITSPTEVTDPSEDDVSESSGDYSEYSSSEDDESTLPEDGITDENNNGEVTDDPNDDQALPNPNNFVCPIANGNFKHPNDCSKFIICSNYIPYVFNCQSGLYYNELTDSCEYSPNVQCD